MARAALSGLFQDVRGRLGEDVIIMTRQGLAVRGRPKYRYPKIAAVEAGNQRLKLATLAWNDLGIKQVELWRTYAASLSRTEPVTGKRYSPTAKSAFIGLATKFLQINPEGEVPTLPPLTDFTYDNLVMSVENHPGGVRFVASAPNSVGTATEILMQKLPNERRSPGKFYKSLLFHTFNSGSLTLNVALEPGVYAFAYRFVRPATGQATSELLLGCILVDA